MSYIEEKYEQKQLRHFSWLCSGLKTSDFLLIPPAFCMQRQKTVEADAKCVNWDCWFIGEWFQKSVKIASI